MKATFGRVNSQTVEQLKATVGEKNVLTQEEERQKYSWDESCTPRPRLPEVVVKPVDTAAVAGVLALANKERIPVTPRGSGTGVSGGCVPLFGGILLSTEAMNRVLKVDKGNFVAVAEAGAPLSALYQAVEQRGLYYPLYPGEKSASIGGNVATNAAGMRAIKYGVTRNFVLGLEAVLPTGEVIRTGGKFVQCSTAYDLTQLLTGSEGTLAVILIVS